MKSGFCDGQMLLRAFGTPSEPPAGHRGHVLICTVGVTALSLLTFAVAVRIAKQRDSHCA